MLILKFRIFLNPKQFWHCFNKRFSVLFLRTSMRFWSRGFVDLIWWTSDPAGRNEEIHSIIFQWINKIIMCILLALILSNTNLCFCIFNSNHIFIINYVIIILLIRANTFFRFVQQLIVLIFKPLWVGLQRFLVFVFVKTDRVFTVQKSFVVVDWSCLLKKIIEIQFFGDFKFSVMPIQH
jgi:hypothetical protein